MEYISDARDREDQYELADYKLNSDKTYISTLMYQTMVKKKS